MSWCDAPKGHGAVLHREMTIGCSTGSGGLRIVIRGLNRDDCRSSGAFVRSNPTGLQRVERVLRHEVSSGRCLLPFYALWRSLSPAGGSSRFRRVVPGHERAWRPCPGSVTASRLTGTCSIATALCSPLPQRIASGPTGDPASAPNAMHPDRWAVTLATFPGLGTGDSRHADPAAAPRRSP